MILHRFIAYDPSGAKRASLPYPSGWSYSSPFDDKAALTFSYQDGLPGYDALLTPCEVAVETSNDGGATWTEMRNGRFLRTDRGYDSGSVKVRKYTLPSFALNFDKGFLDRSDQVDANGKYTYTSSTAGAIIRDVILNAQVGAWCPILAMDFTGLVDSAGVAWGINWTIGYSPGTSIWAILDDLVNRGAVDWFLQGRTLRVFKADTFMAGHPDVFVQRTDLSKLSITGSLADLAHTIVAYGDADTENSSYSDNTTPQYWGRWFATVSSSGDDVAAQQANSLAELADTAHEKVQYAATLDLTRSVYTPLYTFQPGDYVNMEDEQGVVQSFRCRGINYARSEQGEISCTLIINDRFVEGTLRAARRAANVITGVPVKGGTTTTSTTVPKGNVTPAKGTLTSVIATAYINGSGYSRARLEISFPAITTGIRQISKTKTKAVTGQVMRRYEFRVAVNDGSLQWIDCGSKTDALTTQFVNGLTPSTSYLVQYAGVSADGIQGPWSDSFVITTPDDVLPPPKPSTPTVTSRLGQLIVNWDGKNTVGATMGKDFERVDIRIIGMTDPQGTLRNGKAPYVVPGVVIGQSYQVYLRPYDRQGNVGTDSDNAAAVTVLGIMDDPQAALDIKTQVTVGQNTYSPNAASGTAFNEGARWFQIDGNNTVTGQWHFASGAWVQDKQGNATIASINAGIITSGTLLAARIATDTITSNMIVAGAISAVKLSATAIDAMTITGVTINGGTITGSAFQTALPGAANRTVIGYDGRFYAFGYNSDDGTTQMMWDFKPYALADGAHAGTWGYARFYIPVWANEMVSPRLSNKSADGQLMYGQELGLLGYTTDYGGASIYCTADSSGGRVYSISIYARTYTNAANIYMTSAYTLGRSTSASKYKNNVQGLSEELVQVDPEGVVVKDSAGGTIVSYRDILSLEPKVWHDRTASEAYADSLSNPDMDLSTSDIPRMDPIPGLIAEDVLAALGPEFVEFGADGTTVEGIMYDRVWILLIPLIRDLRDRLGALEAK